MRSMSCKGVLLILAILLCAGLSFGQATKTYGSIEGTVKDASGGVIPGVTVTITGATGNKTAVSGDAGEFNFPFLTPGSFDVKAELQSFKTYEQKGVVVRLGQATTVQVVLQTGELSETVIVSERAPQVDTTTTTVGANISDAMYGSIPTQRNFTALLNLAPGVGDSGAAGASNPSIGGGTGLENNVVVDGVNVTNPGYGGTGTYSAVYGSLGSGVNFDFVKEVQVKSGGFEAEYGQSTGGVVNVITKSGGNQFHGGVYFYYAPTGFQANRAQANTYRQTKGTFLLAQEQFDVSADVNGYLKKDKFFFYVGFNPQRNTAVRMAPPDSAQWTNGMTENPGFYEARDKIYSWSTKLNWVASSNHNFEFSTTADPSQRSTGPNRNMTGWYDGSYSKWNYGSWNFIGRYNGVITNNWFLTASVGRAFNRFTENPLHPDYISYTDYSDTSLPVKGGLGFRQDNQSENWQINAKTSFNFNAGGAHQLDFGYTYEDIKYDGVRGYTGPMVTVPDITWGGASHPGWLLYGTAGRWRNLPTKTVIENDKPVKHYVVNNDGSALDYTKFYYQLTRGNSNAPEIGTTTKYHSVYAQDAWKMGKHITLKAGLRYDYQKMGGSGEGALGYTFKGNWAPRFGLIYDVFGDGKTKIYGSAGKFFEKVPNDIAVRSFSYEHGLQNVWFEGTIKDGVLTLGKVMNGEWRWDDASKPGYSYSQTGGKTEVYPGTKTMYQNELVLGVDHQLKNDLSIGARFIWRDVQRVLEDVGTITLDQDALGVPQFFVIANPSFTSDFVVNDTGELGADGKGDGFIDPLRSYTAFEFTMEKRFSNNFQLMANYRLAKLWGNYEGLFRNDNGQNDPNISSLWDYRWNGRTDDPLYWQFQAGYLNTDRRHTLNVNGAYVFNKATFGLSLRCASGAPLTGYLAHPAYQNAGELPDGPRGNHGRSDWINNVDIHVDYPFQFGDNYKLRFGFDVFNVMNRKKATTIDQNLELAPNLINPDFLTPTAFQRSLNARFSARFEF